MGCLRLGVAFIVQAAPRPAASASKESTGWLPDLRKSDTSLGKIAHGGLDGARGQLAFSAEHSALALASSSSVLQQVGSGPPGAWAAERPAERKRCSGRGSDLRGSFQRFCAENRAFRPRLVVETTWMERFHQTLGLALATSMNHPW